MSELDTCKQLRVAGISQGDNPPMVARPTVTETIDGIIYHYHKPTIAELLDALGERFGLLELYPPHEWRAVAYKTSIDKRYAGTANTAWQALANLFIAVSEGK